MECCLPLRENMKQLVVVHAKLTHSSGVEENDVWIIQ